MSPIGSTGSARAPPSRPRPGPGVLAIGFPAPALVGLLAGHSNLVPHVGPIVVGAIIMGISLVNAPTLLAAVLPTLVFIGIQTSEGDVVTPSIVGCSARSSPRLSSSWPTSRWSMRWTGSTPPGLIPDMVGHRSPAAIPRSAA